MEAEDQDTFVRSHGFQRPFHPKQIAGWVLAAYFVLVFSVAILPLLDRIAFIVFGILFYLDTVLIIVFAIFTTRVDTTDTVHLEHLAAKIAHQEFDLRPHVTRWNVCDTCVGPRAKHWFDCNRCWEEFDHHCQWLNNWVGRQNYIWFVWCIVALAINQMIMILVMSLLLHNMDNDMQQDIMDNVYGTKRIEIFQAIYGISLFLLIPLFIGNACLIGFHIRIRCNEITTYDFILGKRANDKKIAASKNKYQIAPEKVDKTGDKSLSECNSLDELSFQHVKS